MLLPKLGDEGNVVAQGAIVPNPGFAQSEWYRPTWADVTPKGPDGIFTASQLDQLLAVLDRVRSAALAA